MRTHAILLAVTMLAASSAAADPPAAPAAPASTDPAPPLTRAPTVAPFLAFDPPPPPVASLRIEALRIAGERAANDWRYPVPEPVFGWQEDGFYIGYGHHRPRTARSAALRGGSIASTLFGQILLEAAPIAGAALLVTGATLDAAAADVDRDAEAKR